MSLFRRTPPPPPPPPPPVEDTPTLIRWVVSFLLVGMAWGLTTPFIRKGAVEMQASARPALADSRTSWLSRRVHSLFYQAVDLLRNPRYSVPLLINLTGSIWFFLLIGKAELSLTVPITNSLAFLFTVLGEWWAEGKVISRDTWLGMGCILGGIALCVSSKST